MILQRFQSSDTTADNHAEAISSLQFFDIYAAVLEGHFRRCHGKLCKTIGSPDVLRISEEWLWVEVPHFAGDLAIVPSRIECLDPANSAYPILKVRPKRLHVIANGRDGAEASNDNSAIVHKKSDE